MWALRSDHVVQVTSLSKQRRCGRRRRAGDGVGVGAHQRSAAARSSRRRCILNTLPGDQYAAALRAAPTARPRLRLPPAIWMIRRAGRSRSARPASWSARRCATTRSGPTPDPARRPGDVGADRPAARHPDRDGHLRLLRAPAADARRGGRRADRDLLQSAASGGLRWRSPTSPSSSDAAPPSSCRRSSSTTDPASPPSVGLSSTVITLGAPIGGPAPDIRFVQTSRHDGADHLAALTIWTWRSWRSGRSRPGRAEDGDACAGLFPEAASFLAGKAAAVDDRLDACDRTVHRHCFVDRDGRLRRLPPIVESYSTWSPAPFQVAVSHCSSVGRCAGMSSRLVLKPRNGRRTRMGGVFSQLSEGGQ